MSNIVINLTPEIAGVESPNIQVEVHSAVSGTGTGPAGPAGASGPAGATGPEGAAATVNVGTTSSGPAAVTNSGTSSAAVFNFTVPTGSTGAAGPSGPAGPTGPTGLYVPTVNSATSSTSPMAWDSTSYQMYILTNLANDLTVSADSGTPVVGQKMIFRFISTSTRTLTWTTGSSKSFRAMGVTLPTILTANKITYLGCIYNAVDLRWDVIAVGAEQ